jgi:hypothetical protein
MLRSVGTIPPDILLMLVSYWTWYWGASTILEGNIISLFVLTMVPNITKSVIKIDQNDT